jgi:predicted metalloprotease with PDZ domain
MVRSLSSVVRFGALASAGWLVAVSVAHAQDVRYRVHYTRAGDAAVGVSLALPTALPAPQVLVVPRAIPMGYSEAPYDDFVDDVRAFTAEGVALPVVREEGPRWRLGAEGASVARVEYGVDLIQMEASILAASDASRVRRTYVSLLGYSVFGYIDGVEDSPLSLEVEGPAGWPVLTTLAPGDTSATPRTARAASYYALADSQVVMGPGMQVRRVESVVPLTVVMYAEAEADVDSLAEVAASALRRVADYFGSVPFGRYTVIQEYLTPLSDRHRYGFSMEHLDSSTFYLAADAALLSSSPPAERRRTLYNCAHHMAHAWIPKRAYGEGYYPFTWELAPVLDTIWFSEGFAQFAAIEAVAAGEADPAAYRRGMLDARFAGPLGAMPAFLRRMPLVQLSRIASTRYSEDFRTGRTSFARGGLMAAAIDDRIRERTSGKKSLRDALRYLVAWSEERRRPFRTDELPSLFTDATGVDTRDLFDQWLGPMPDR